MAAKTNCNTNFTIYWVSIVGTFMDFRDHASTVSNNCRIREVALVSIDALYFVERYSKKRREGITSVFRDVIGDYSIVSTRGVYIKYHSRYLVPLWCRCVAWTILLFVICFSNVYRID